MVKFGIVDGTHLILYNEDDFHNSNNVNGRDTLELKVPGIPLHLMADFFQRIGLSDKDILEQIELVVIEIDLQTKDIDKIEQSVLQSDDPSSLNPKREVHVAHVKICSNHDDSNDDNQQLTSIEIFRSDNEKSSIQVTERLPFNKVLCEVRDVGSVLIFDFFSNMLDQVLFLPCIYGSACTDGYESLKLILLCSLSRALVTDGMHVCGRTYPFEVFQDKSLYSLQCVDDSVVKSFHEHHSIPNDTQSASVKNIPSPTNHSALEKLTKGLESRIASEIKSTQCFQESRCIVDETSIKAENSLFQFVRMDTNNISNDLLHHNDFISVFPQDKEYKDSDLTKTEKNIKGINQQPLQVTSVSWKSQRGSGCSILLDIDLLCHESAITASTNDPESPTVTHFQEIFVSCSSLTGTDTEGVQTISGCIPLLLPGQCAAIRAKTFFSHSYLGNLKSLEATLEIKAHWKEFQSSIPFCEGNTSTKRIEQGMPIGRMRIPVEDIILEASKTALSFIENPPIPIASFDYRKPRIIQISHPIQGYSSLESFKKKLENQSCNSDIHIDPEEGKIKVYAETLQTRANILKILLKNFPDDIEIKENDTENKKNLIYLLESISSELKMMKRHAKFSQTSDQKNIFEDLLRAQIVTDEISSMARSDF